MKYIPMYITKFLKTTKKNLESSQREMQQDSCVLIRNHKVQKEEHNVFQVLKEKSHQTRILYLLILYPGKKRELIHSQMKEK